MKTTCPDSKHLLGIKKKREVAFQTCARLKEQESDDLVPFPEVWVCYSVAPAATQAAGVRTYP